MIIKRVKALISSRAMLPMSYHLVNKLLLLSPVGIQKQMIESNITDTTEAKIINTSRKFEMILLETPYIFIYRIWIPRYKFCCKIY